MKIKVILTEAIVTTEEEISLVGDEFEIISLIAIKYINGIGLCDIIKLL